MYKNYSQKGGMSFLLAQTLLFQLHMLEGTLQGRINHISLLFSEVKAIIDGKQDLKISKEDNDKLIEVSVNIDSLRDSYEPFLDDPDGKLSTDDKRKSIEKLIDLSRYNILYIIEKYTLIDASSLKEITGLSWSET